MLNQFSRTELIIGKNNVQKLNESKVAIFGLGGVGSYVVEGLARAGVENFILVDNDNVSITNLNRQLIATHETIGKPKVEIAKDRILSINPNAKVKTYCVFYMPNQDDCKEIIDNTIDYVVDAVDTVTAKIAIITKAKELNIPVISCMGTGNKMEPTRFQISDISKTSVCPLAKVIRKELKNRNIENVKVLYSTENPVSISDNLGDNSNVETKGNGNNPVPGSISFVPSVAGLIIAGEVVKDVINWSK